MMNKGIKYGLSGCVGCLGLFVLMVMFGVLFGGKHPLLVPPPATVTPHKVKKVAPVETDIGMLPKLRHFATGDKFVIGETAYPCHLYPSLRAIQKEYRLYVDYDDGDPRGYISYKHTIVLPPNTPGTVIKWVKKYQYGFVLVNMKDRVVSGWCYAFHMHPLEKGVMGY